MEILANSLIASGFFLIALHSGVWLGLADGEKEVRAADRARKKIKRAPDGFVVLEAIDPQDIKVAAKTIGTPRNAFGKRAIDIGMSLALLIFLFPVLVVTAIAIKLDSRGPLIYRQRRVGYQGREFDVLKLRSMVSNAEANGPQYAAKKDARVTKVGYFIRKTRLDEIPQAVNVLRGEMSFVGPRPERPEFVTDLEKAIPHYHCRHLVKPGITGWAQVKYEYTASVEGAREKLKYDLYYISNYSLLLEIWIILKTVRVALFGLGSR